MAHMRIVHDDGGRAESGFTGKTGDCVVRAVAIAAQRPYAEVYDALSAGMQAQRKTKRSGPKSSARSGVNVTRKWFKDYMATLGFRWVPTMRIGSGCTVHLEAGALPMGRLVVSVSKHYTSVIDGVVHDTHNPQREDQNIYGGRPVMDAEGQLRNPIVQKIGGRCVYGYWVKA